MFDIESVNEVMSKLAGTERAGSHISAIASVVHATVKKELKTRPNPTLIDDSAFLWAIDPHNESVLTYRYGQNRRMMVFALFPRQDNKIALVSTSDTPEYGTRIIELSIDELFVHNFSGEFVNCNCFTILIDMVALHVTNQLALNDLWGIRKALSQFADV